MHGGPRHGLPGNANSTPSSVNEAGQWRQAASSTETVAHGWSVELESLEQEGLERYQRHYENCVQVSKL